MWQLEGGGEVGASSSPGPDPDERGGKISDCGSLRAPIKNASRSAMLLRRRNSRVNRWSAHTTTKSGGLADDGSGDDDASPVGQKLQDDRFVH